jgi:hypothetical protein
MKTMRKSMTTVLAAMMVVVLVASFVYAAEEMSVQGRVTKEGQFLRDNGTTYTIEQNQMGKQLIQEVGGTNKVVKAQGYVMETTTGSGSPTLRIDSYNIQK